MPPNSPSTVTKPQSPSRVASPNLIRNAKVPYGQHLAKDLESLSFSINDLYGYFTSAGIDLKALASFLAAKWLPWTPTFTAANGAFNLSNLWLNVWLQQGPIVYFQLRFTAATTVSTVFLYFTLPPPKTMEANNFSSIPASIAETAPAGMNQMELCPSRIMQPNQGVIQRQNNAAFPVGSYLFAVSGFYRTS